MILTNKERIAEPALLQSPKSSRWKRCGDLSEELVQLGIMR